MTKKWSTHVYDISSLMVSNDEEIKLSFLLSGSCDLPSSYIKLRSYLNIHLATVAEELNLNLCKSLRNRNKTCPYCYTSWSAETASIKLLPAKKFRPPVKSKEDDNVKEVRNTLVLKCRVCTKRSLFSMVKRKYVEKKEVVKKTDKSCSPPKKTNYQSPGMLVKKKKKMGNLEETNKLSQNVHSGKRPPQASKSNKNLVPNPFAVQTHNRSSKKKDKKFERLKQAVRQDQSVAKKTLKDFLSLV